MSRLVAAFRRNPNRSIQTVSAAALLVAAALASFIATGSPPSYAHSGYESSTPADGEVLEASPAQVDMYTSQEMARSGGLPTLTIVNDAGDTLNDGTTLDDEDRSHMFAELPPELPDGRYTVIWHTISDEDGEEATGAFHFYVNDAPDSTTPPTAEPGATTPAAASPTQAPSGSDDGDSGVPVWALIAGVIAGVAVGGGAGVALGRRGQA